MSNTARIAATAANTLTKPLNVEEVFSTYLYKGTDANNITATTGIDMSGEGGMVWFKGRSAVEEGTIVDSARGVDYAHYTPTTAAHFSISGIGFSAPTFTSTGFTVGDMPVINRNTTDDYVAWSFRKAPKFFDVVTYTGDGVAGRTVSHNLGSVPGCIIVKCTSAGANWVVYHRGTDATAPEDYGTKLSGTFAREDNVVFWNDTAPTSTEFTVGTGSLVNSNGASYVAYLFAHNDGDGDFGPTGDQDIIKCGSYTGNGSTDGPDIDLGFEPQWILTKRTDSTSQWTLVDNMRGMPVGGSDVRLYPNLTNADDPFAFVDVTPTGFNVATSASAYNASGGTYIYIAIRRGTAVPESATDVFAIDTQSGGGEPSFTSGFVVDMGIESLVSSASNRRISSRLTQGKALETNTTDADLSSTGYAFDYQNGWFYDGGSNADKYSWMWKRAPNYFDVVAYTGNGVRGRTVSHNLGVVPEMMWIKNRDDAQNWLVYIHSLGGTKKLYLNTTAAAATASIDDFNNTDAEATQFTLGNDGRCNANNQDFVAYLFASLDGVSKVGSYTGTGTSLNIDCGFSSGARFVLIKRTDSTGSWWVFDTERGLVAGADAAINLNTTNAEFSTVDYIDPYSAGFNLTGIGGDINASGGSYIFYAIA